MRVWLGRKVESEEGEKNVILSVGIVGMLISANCESGTNYKGSQQIFSSLTLPLDIGTDSNLG